MLPTVGGVFLGHVQLAKTEIAKRDMPGVIKQDVLRFQITYRQESTNVKISEQHLFSNASLTYR